jgi:arylformamidase
MEPPHSHRRRARLAGLLATVGSLACAASSPAAVPHLDLTYDIDSPAEGSSNLLDLYTPDGIRPGDHKPVVVYVHGGGWRRGDKANKITDKVNLFTNAGYIFSSINYRLSPVGGDPANPDPHRVRFPAHPHDVGEAIGWLDRNVGRYGGDPTRIALVGHSAGAHLVSLVATDPTYVRAYQVEPWQLIGAASLDTDAFDITAEATQTQNTANRDLIWNAFGTPAENAASGSWLAGSPLHWASDLDPPFLLVTSANPNRQADNRAMADALAQDPSGIFVAPYDHQGINEALGSPSDTAGETRVVMDFLTAALTEAKPPRIKFRQRPPKRVLVRGAKARVRFRLASKPGGADFECSLDRRPPRHCKAKVALTVDLGKHRFSARALDERGRPGTIKTFRFRVRHN